VSIKESLTRSYGRTVLQTKKNSPHIFFVAGLVGVVGSTILACRATLKLEKTLDDIQAEFSQIHSMREVSENGGPSYDVDEYRRDLTTAYLHGIVKLARLYGPSVVVGTVSIAALTGSHVQLSHRNTALSAALAAVSQAYDEYRARVREELGEEKEMAIYQGCLLDDPDEIGSGKVTNGASPYGRFFESNNRNWQHDMEFNRVYIECQQRYANHLLTARGHVFLNEIYDALGFDRTPAGAVVGWIYEGNGDGYIDFGLYDAINVDFINGNARGCFLDFNVDGTIFELI
jgi:Family of unknown function (DUF6353)